jgi:thiamine biosynthesis lipoprotein
MDEPARSNRRDFLQGRAALRALQQLQGSREEDDDTHGMSYAESEVRQGQRGYLVQVSRKAMACQFQVFLNAGQHVGDLEAGVDALDLVTALEDQMTVYRDHSEISRINTKAAIQPCVVEPRLFGLLQRCVALFEETGGAFDITAGPLVKLWGFHVRQGAFPATEQIQATQAIVGSQHLELDPETLSIQFGKPGIELNLGSIGKGFALDRCAEVLESADIDDYLIHGGHSSILARGSRLAETPPGWIVALRHPLRPDKRVAEIRLQDKAIGTSGSGNQFFYHHGKRYGHVLDPRTGRPAQGVLSATVLSPNAAQADALATAFFVLGVEAARAFCEDHPELGAIFLSQGKHSGSLRVDRIGIQAGECVLAPGMQFESSEN